MSLNELAHAGVRLRPAEAAAIVSEICRQRSEGRLRGIPSAHVVRITDEGRVIAEGPVNADGPAVARAAHLLEDLMPPIDAPPELRAPGGLRLVIARALGVLDLPPYPSLESFCAAVNRFATPDLPAAARELFAAWVAARQPIAEPGASGRNEEALVPAPMPLLPVRNANTGLTISDVRRARRATGLTLGDVAERSRIPAPLIRELEWGYLRNWPAGRYGRTQLVRYARAAGLDVDVVLDVAEPLLIEAIAERNREYAEAQDEAAEADPSGFVSDVVIADRGEIVVSSAPVPALELRESPVSIDVARPASRRRARLIAALAIPAMIALALIPSAWQPARTNREASHARPAAPTRTAAAEPPALPRTVDVTQPLVRQTSTYSPAFTNTGTAVFFTERARDRSALLRAETGGDGSVLRITR
ncbi:MAG TPA: helix-turn-helix domain-containing protein, partial [Candidatus Elarobacter sp.]|nr:helix-turn-helix domain-containing protein [Candidatus Elarobacter sp.]